MPVTTKVVMFMFYENNFAFKTLESGDHKSTESPLNRTPRETFWINSLLALSR